MDSVRNLGKRILKKNKKDADNNSNSEDSITSATSALDKRIQRMDTNLDQLHDRISTSIAESKRRAVESESGSQLKRKATSFVSNDLKTKDEEEEDVDIGELICRDPNEINATKRLDTAENMRQVFTSLMDSNNTVVSICIAQPRDVITFRLFLTKLITFNQTK